jgi:hypothetical protein
LKARMPSHVWLGAQMGYDHDKFHALSAPIRIGDISANDGEIHPCFGNALGGGRLKPVHGLVGVFLAAFARVVNHTEVKPSLGIVALCCPLTPIGRGCRAEKLVRENLGPD